MNGTLLLVRHAHAGSRHDWDGDDHDRPLSPRGERQATALVALLAPFSPQRVLTSPYERCVATVTPLAEHLGVALERVAELEEGRSGEAIRLLGVLAGETVVACSHGDVVQDTVLTLAERGVAIDGAERWQKGSVWALDTHEGRFVRASYLPPPDRS